MPRAATSVATSTGSLPADEVGQRLLTRALAQVAVDGAGLHALALELLDEPVGAALGAQNTSVRSTPLAIAAATFTLSIWWTGGSGGPSPRRWLVLDSTSCATGSCM